MTDGGGTGRDRQANLILYDSGEAQDLSNGHAAFSFHGAIASNGSGTPPHRGFTITHN